MIEAKPNNRIYLYNIILTNYRNFNNLELSLSDKINILTGENGTGKTNILESISLLAPGRGFRGAKLEEIGRIGTDSWSVRFNLQSKIGLAEVKIEFSLNNKERKIYYNGSKITGIELTNLVNIIWLIPQVESIFLDQTGVRRRFLDRIVYSFDPAYASCINKYEHYIKERFRILKHQSDSEELKWLGMLEEKIAIAAMDIYHKRKTILLLLQNKIDNTLSAFPKAILTISPLFTRELEGESFITNYRDQMSYNRQKDYYSGRTNFGVHRLDFIVFHQQGNIPARLCSTGEQKALLISIILAQIAALVDTTKIAPILLLDEFFVHLDQKRTEYLEEYLLQSNSQIFITATDPELMQNLASYAKLIKL